MAGDDEQLNLLLSSMSQQQPDINSVLYSEIDQSQAEYFTMDEELRPSQHLKMYEQNVNQELSIDEIQRILDLPQTELLSMTENMPRKARTESICVSSPESGISGCDDQEARSPLIMDQVQSMYQDQTSFKNPTPTVPFTPSGTTELSNTQTFNIDNSSQNYFQGIDMSSLLQLADESNQLMESSETDLQRLTASKPFIMSPMTTTNNPMFGQTQQPMQPRPATVLRKAESGHRIVITGPNHLGTAGTEGKKEISPTPSVIVTNKNAFTKHSPSPATSNLPTSTRTYTYETVPSTSSNFSIPGSMIFANNDTTLVDVENLENLTTSNNTLPVTVLEMDLPVVDRTASIADNVEDPNNLIKPKVEPSEYVCYVCGEKAGKHSYYGGQVCASCRAFFRRSVQSKYYEIFQCKKEKKCQINSETRKNCQFCRFKKCLESGMKPSWVLSDEERNRRFNKFNKIKLKTVNPGENQITKVQASRIPELYMTFTMEEQKSLEDLHQKFNVCQRTWLKNLLLLDRNAGVNMIEAAYKLAPLKFETWKVLEKSFHLYFVQNVVPKFIDVDNLPSSDKGQIINGQNSGMAHLFKSSQCLKIDSPDSKEPPCKQETMCPMQKQVSDIASNPAIMESLDLSQMMSRLNLSEIPKFPTYQEIYPQKWANNDEVEQRHMEIIKRLQSWPRKDNNELDFNMVILMTLMLIFNADFDGLVNKTIVENVQLKYSMLLQRYLRSKMSPEIANKKFLEAMILLSYTKEVWDMNNMYGK